MSSELSHRSRKRVKEIKRKARPGKRFRQINRLLQQNVFLHNSSKYPELSDKLAWIQLDYAKKFDTFMEFPDSCDRINANEYDCDLFIEKYEKIYKPVVIKGLQEGWKGNQKWTLEKLAKKYRNQKFKCGEDNDGYSVKMKMSMFLLLFFHFSYNFNTYISSSQNTMWST